MSQKTRTRLIEHTRAYPALQIEDVFKYLFHSACGCEHLVSDEQAALYYVQREYDAMHGQTDARIERLDGSYARVHLGILAEGLHPRTLARLFYLSALPEPSGKTQLEDKLQIAREMITDGTLPYDLSEFDRKLAAWREASFPAMHHSETFRQAYHPAYRVISAKFVPYLPVFCEIDKQLSRNCTIVTIEGGAASGKSTLASLLQEVYACNVFHTDDFFLRPEQRTPARLGETGGNFDRERFANDVLTSLCMQESVKYRKYDCGTQTLGEVITVPHNALTVIEGVYSMHPAFGQYYDLAIFLEIDPALQHRRISVRNSPYMANRFFTEWIPMENAYFTAFDVKNKAHLILPSSGQV